MAARQRRTAAEASVERSRTGMSAQNTSPLRTSSIQVSLKPRSSATSKRVQVSGRRAVCARTDSSSAEPPMPLRGGRGRQDHRHDGYRYGEEEDLENNAWHPASCRVTESVPVSRRLARGSLSHPYLYYKP